WADEDQIGIYTALDNQSDALNISYTAIPSDANPAYCSFTPTELSQTIYWQAASKQSFYAYYPWTEVIDAEEDASAHPFTLATKQLQVEGNSPAHVAEYGLLTAAPFVAEANAQSGNVSFAFKNAFSIVEFRLKATDDCPIAELPVKSMTLTTTGAPLSGKVAVNLTATPATFTTVEAAQSLTLDLGTTVGLKKDGYTSFYMVVLPGTHAADALALELTAIDNSKQTITIAEGVTFEPNKHYVREGVLTLDGFQLDQPFEIELPAIEAKVGEPFTVQFKGAAEQIDFWSGETGHDYAYADKDRVLTASMQMSLTYCLVNGNQPNSVAIKYSTDYNGGGTEADVLAATWTDVSDQFTLSNTIQTSTSINASMLHHTGLVDCSEWFGAEGTEGYIALFYTAKAPGNPDGRSYLYLFDITVNETYPHMTNRIYPHSFYLEYGSKRWESYTRNIDGETCPIPTIIFGSTHNSEDSTNSCMRYSATLADQYPCAIRLGAVFRPKVDRYTYFVLPKLARPASQNLGKDQPFEIQAADAETPASWSYTFTEPGTYKVYVIGTIMTLAGEQEVVKEVTVTVTA
ncbi:MAG: DUF5017 domain-containing protein, partial [Alistipes sp.]|nr:DUF5017 domain-containing protein [Alistipes sp.]